MTSFGKYQGLECIGEGGFGRVFRGYDPVLKRNIAIKTCTLRDPTMRERFAREAEIAANLRHPNIVTVYDFGEQEGEPYIVQEYLEGEDLDDRIKRDGEIPLPTVVGWLRQIADGLLYAHGRGVVHRDVKPGNLRLLPDGQIRIMDFGIAKLLQSERQLTQSGTSLGTVGYLAPEQLRGSDIDHRVDIFSFGVVAYELVARQRPFDGDSVTEIMYRIAHEDPAPLRELAPGCAPRLAAMIDRCLKKMPDERYASLHPVIEELDALAREVGGAAQTPAASAAPSTVLSPAPGVPAQPPAPPKRRLSPSTWGFITAAVAVGVLGILNLFRTLHSTTPDRPAVQAPVEAAAAPAADSVKPDPTTQGPDSSTERMDSAVNVATRDTSSPKPADTASPTTAREPNASEPTTVTKAKPRPTLPGGPPPPPRRAVPPPLGARRVPDGSPAATPVSPTRVVLLVRSELRLAAQAAEDALAEELGKAGYEVVDPASSAGPFDEAGLAGGQANEVARIGLANGAASVLLVDASADARPFSESMFTGSAAVRVRVYPTASGRLETSKRFEVGTAQVPGELAPTESAAASAAVRTASYGAARFLVGVLQGLR